MKTNNTIKPFALSLITLLCGFSFAGYVIHIPTEVKFGGSLPDGTINFVKPTDGGNNGGGETPVEPEVPVEPEKPETPHEKKEFLYSTAINTLNYSGSEYLFNNQSLSGTPLSCGDLGISCVVIGHQTGLVNIKYTGHNVNYANGFYHPDKIIVKSSYLSTATDCSLSGTSTEPWATQTGGGVHFTMTYNCGSGKLPAPLAPPYTAERNPGTSLGFSIEFFKVTE
jgi:hypothetical protein